MKRAFLPFLLVYVLFSCAAGATEPTYRDSVPKNVLNTPEDSFLTFSVENDMLGGGTDRNYTSGVRLTYFNLGTRLPDFAYTLDEIIPTFSINETTSVYYSIGQNLYTPENITQTAQDLNDRPWAALLYASAGLTSITHNHIDDIEAAIGVVGPMAMGRQTQSFVHKHISNSPAPMGWDNQLKNEPALLLSWQRRWPERYGFEALGLSAGADPYLGVTAGNVYTYTSGGISFRLTPKNGIWQDNPARVRPAMPGGGAFVVPDSNFSWFLFGGAEGRAVARNIFLDGNTFRDSYSVDKKILVGDLTGGLALTYGPTRLSYALIYRTKEFTRQKNGDVFGSVSLGVRF